jgi:hypothetical protein
MSEERMDKINKFNKKEELIEERRKVCAAIMVNYQKQAEARESNNKLEQRLFEIEEQLKD